MESKFEETLNLFQWNDPLELALDLSPKDHEKDWQIAAIGKYQKRREAWALSRFAFGYQKFFGVATQVRMVDDREQSPDGVVKIGTEEIPFDVTMVIDPERRMQLEIKEAAKAQKAEKLKFRPTRYPNKSELLTWIKSGLQGKQRCAYKGLNLLIYLNAWHQQLHFRDFGVLTTESSAWTDVWIICSSGWDEQYALTTITNNRMAGWFEFKLVQA